MLKRDCRGPPPDVAEIRPTPPPPPVVVDSVDVYDALVFYYSSPEMAETMSAKLEGYKLVERICDVVKGRYLRWTVKGKDAVTRGGVFVGVTFTKEGTVMLCKLPGAGVRYTKYRFDESLTFERMTAEEMLLESLG